MPCFDGGPSYEQRLDERRVPAMLCALANALESRGELHEWLHYVDFREAGVTREWFIGWWTEHKAEDARRKAREQEDRDRQAARARALAKLTAEERAAL
jgi:hypothetical protein